MLLLLLLVMVVLPDPFRGIGACRKLREKPTVGPRPKVVVLLDPFRGMGAWRNSTETQQSGHASRSGQKVKNGRNSAKDGAP